MLEHLRERITAETRPLRATKPSTAIRAVTIALSESLSSLREIQEEIFPTYPPELDAVRPFLTATKGDFAEQLEKDVRRALALDVAAQFVRSGISLRRSSLIFVLGDINDSDFSNALSSVSVAIRNVTAQSQLAGHSFFVIGVFLFDSATIQAKGLNLQSLCSDLYSKVFLLDARNPSGLELPAEDRCFQAAHVLRFLERFPESCGSDEEFVEWMQNASPASGYCSSLGGSTIYYPVDAILETACVQAGARLLSDSLLHANNDERHVFYANKFKLDTGLTSLGDLESLLARATTNPLGHLAASTGDPDEDVGLLAELQRIDGTLSSLAAEYETALQAEITERLAGWKQVLSDYVDAIVTGECGGLRLAVVFLDSTVSMVQGLVDAASPLSAVPDPAINFAQTAAAVNGLPSTTSLAVRAITGAGAAGYTALSGPFSTSGNLALAVGVPTGILAFAGLWRHAALTKSERSFAELRGAISAKWERLLGSAVRRIATQLLLGFSGLANQLKDDLQRSVVRAGEAAEWFIENHAAQVPQSSTLHWPLLQGREELIQAASPIVEITGLPPSSYMPQNSDVFLWRRLAQPGEAVPNAYEWHILEQAAVTAFGRCRRVLDTRLLLRLHEDPARLKQVRAHGRLTAEPFLTLRPGAGEPETTAILEADGTDCEGTLRQLEADLRPHFTRLTTVGRSSPYLIALTSIAVRIAFSDVAGLGQEPS